MRPAYRTHGRKRSKAGGRLPTFIVVGAGKAGTTSLYRYLSGHPQVFMSERKELDFFVEEENWGLGKEWYEGQFAQAAATQAVGEASPRYTAYPKHGGVPARMASMVPEARLVYLVRHPIERMRSHYLQLVNAGRERRPIEKALLAGRAYMDQSLYAMQMERYLDYFPRHQLLVVQSEHLKSRRTETLRRIHTFIGTDSDVLPERITQEFNRAEDKRVPRWLTIRLRRVHGYHRAAALLPNRIRMMYRQLAERPTRLPPTELSQQFRARLEDLFREDVRALRAFIEPDFDGWGIG